MKQLLLMIGGLALCGPALAQLNMAALQNSPAAAAAAVSMPVYLGDGYDRCAINLFNAWGSLGSNFATARNVRDYLRADRFTKELVGSSIGRLKPVNHIQAALDVSILNVGINLGKGENGPVFSLGFGAGEHVALSTSFNRTLFYLAYNGNKQFAGQTISIAPRVNALAYTDYWVSGALRLTLPNTAVTVKPALRLRYLSGQASVQMPAGNSVTLYTEPDGRYLDFGMNYTVNTSTRGDTITLSGSSFTFDRSTFRQGAGSGFGLDLGLRIQPAEDASIDLSITDLGSIRFRKNTVNMYNYSKYRYEGQEITFENQEGISLDSLTGIVAPRYASQPYSVALPARLVLSGSLGIDKAQQGRYSYYRHQLTFTYLQGFDNYLSATKIPWFAIGYTHSFGGVLNAGANIGAGGLWGVSIGALASLRLGAFRIGLSSGNLLPLVAPRSGRGTDASLLLGLAF